MSQVYFLHAPAVNLIKIGRSVDPERRFEELRLLSPVPLTIVGLMDGGSAEEADLHKQFSDLHSHGEWFHASAALLQFAQTKMLEFAWNRAGADVRRHFIERYVDTPVFDRGAA